MCCKSRRALSRLGLLWGVSALAALLVAFISGSWLYTKEPVMLPNSQVSTSITFRIGLWKVCPQVRRVNSTIRYSTGEPTMCYHCNTDADGVACNDPLNKSTARIIFCSNSTIAENLDVKEELDFTSDAKATNDTYACTMLTYINSDVPSPACSLLKYSGWQRIQSSDLGVWTSLDLAQVFISRMRSCTVLCGSAIILLLLAVFLALLGHCYSDSKTVIACGFFILGGLCIGTGLVVFVSALSDTLMEISQYHKEPPTGPLYDYNYGWCFFTAGIAFIMANMAALFSISGYLNRFASVDEMVRQMVPGAERKLLEQQHLSTEYLVKHSDPSALQYDPLPRDRSKYDPDCACGPLLNKTPPDVCSTSNCPDISLADSDPAGLMAESTYSVARTLAGQTVPITVKNHNSTAPLSLCNLPVNKYGTIHHGFLGVGEVGSSSTGDYCGRSKTLQHQKSRKKCITIETFQVPESGFAEFSSRRTSDFEFSGSAV